HPDPLPASGAREGFAERERGGDGRPLDWALPRHQEEAMAYVDPRLQGKPAPVVPVAKMEGEHTARLARVKGSDIAFLDQRIPAYRREIINIIGMGVTENVKDPELAPKIKAPAHGFAIAYVRAPKGCGAALHRHPTEEVFVTLK